MLPCRTFLFTAAALFSLASGGQAADYTTTADLFQGDVLRPSITPKLGGFVVGAVGGFTWGEADFSSDIYPKLNFTDNLEGPDGGLLIGYEITNGPFFTGFEVLGLLGGPTKDYDFEDGSALEYGVDGHVDVRFRSGWMFSERIAGYGIIGATAARVSVEAGDGLEEWGSEEWRLGWVGGAGLEVLLHQNFSLAAEYNYTGLEQEVYEDLSVDGSFHAVRGAIRARF